MPLLSTDMAAGHTASWGKGYPDLLTPCYTDSQPNGELGPLTPAHNGTFEALWALFRELATLFPDSYLHLGGDEVPFDCWQARGSLFTAKSHLPVQPGPSAVLSGAFEALWALFRELAILFLDSCLHLWLSCFHEVPFHRWLASTQTRRLPNAIQD